MVFGNTRAVLNNLIKRIKLVKKFFDITLQVVLLLMCGFFIINNLHNLVRLIIYSIMFVLSIGWLIYTIIYYNNENKTKEQKIKHRKTAIALKYIKLVYRISLIIYSIIEMSIYGSTLLSYIVLIFSGILFFIQIIITIISNQISHYATMFEHAIEKDTSVGKKTKNVLEKIAHPVYGVSSIFVKNKQDISNEDSKKDEVLNKMNEDFKIDIENKKEKNKQEKISIKEKLVKKRKETVSAFKEKIKRKLNKNNNADNQDLLENK